MVGRRGGRRPESETVVLLDTGACFLELWKWKEKVPAPACCLVVGGGAAVVIDEVMVKK